MNNNLQGNTAQGIGVGGDYNQGNDVNNNDTQNSIQGSLVSGANDQQNVNALGSTGLGTSNMSSLPSAATRIGRNTNFKKGLNQDDSRRRREQLSVQIRKNKREENLTSRRRLTTGTPSTGVGGRNDENYDGDDPNAPLSNQQRLEQIPQIKNMVYNPDPINQLEAVTQFRRLLSIEKNPPIQPVIDSGVVPKFVEFLERHDNPNLQFEAAWALTNIASGTSIHTKVVIENGAVPIFVQLLSSPSPEVREQAVWALGNIAGDSPKYRDLVLRHGAMKPLLAQLHRNAQIGMLRNATWTLSNFCRGKQPPDFDQVKVALPTLAQLIYSVDEDVLTDACWALSYLSDGTNDKIQAVIAAGVCRRLIELLMHHLAVIQTPALRTVGNIVTGDDLQTGVIIGLKALPCLLSLLSHPRKNIRKEACWTISNITAGSPEQIEEVIKAGLIRPLVSLLANAEYEVKKEAAWAISNATTGGTDEQIKLLVRMGCIMPLCDLLIMDDPKIITVALEGLENILRVGGVEKEHLGTSYNAMAMEIGEAGGWQKIAQLQYHRMEEIYKKVIKLVDTYCEEDVEEPGDDIEEDMNDQVGSEQNQNYFNNQDQIQGTQSLGQQPQQFSFNNVNNMQMPPAPPDGGDRYKF